MTRLIAFAVGFVIACGADAQTLQLEGDCGAPELQGLVGQTAEIAAVSYTHLTLPTTPYV